MSNPYSSPDYHAPSSGRPPEVKAPAIALMVVAGIAIVVGIFSLLGDAVLLFSGAIARLEEMNEGPNSKYLDILIRTIWGIILVAASAYVLYGAIQMKNFTNYTAARTAAIISVIPCLGPCCFLGIPFGIWALVVLAKPEVKDAFR